MSVNKTRLLFVDDEVAVLDGLRDLLRKERKRWEMVFAVGGEAALTELVKMPFDVVVSDMRMPGMDGAQLLAKVKDDYPQAARIVLTGHAEREAVMRAMPVAHQFLSKPCDAAILRSTLERTLDLHRYVDSPAVLKLVGKLDHLPSVPRTYVELTETAADPKSGLNELAKIIEKDPSMSAKVLQLVNSAYFGVAQRVTSIRQAVNYLGIELLKALALSCHAFSALSEVSGAGFSIEKMQDRSLKVAQVAKRLLGDARAGDEAFTAALLQDVGTLVLAMIDPQLLAQIEQERKATGRRIEEIEQEKLGATHAQIGAYLLGVWGLPSAIVEAVAFHHRPSQIGPGSCEVLAATHAADALIDQVAPDPSRDLNPLDLAFLARAGHQADVERWLQIAQGVAAPTGGAPS